MSLLRSPNKEPLWRDEFSVFTSDERYVNRRQFTKFLTLASFGMFAGNLWILAKSRFARTPAFPPAAVARGRRNPGRRRETVHLSDAARSLHPGSHQRRRIRRLQPEMHASVVRRLLLAKDDQLECPCHQGFFSPKDGSVLQGPPPRPLPQIALERDGTKLIAVGVRGS